MTASIVPDWVIREDVRNTSAYPVTPATGMVKLDAMENPYTLPEPLRQALAARLAAVDLNRYPDPTAPQLRQQLRQVMDIPERHGLLLGNGSDEIRINRRSILSCKMDFSRFNPLGLPCVLML